MASAWSALTTRTEHRGSRKAGGKDHHHRLRHVKPYDYTNGGALVAAFWTEVKSVLEDKGH